MNTKNIRSIAVLATGLALAAMIPFAALADNPVPFVNNVVPSSVAAGTAGFTLIVHGSNFVPGAMVNFNGSSRPTTYISSNQVDASVFASDTSNTGSFSVNVTNPGPGGGTSNSVTFTVGNINGVASISSLSPSSAAMGSSGFTLTVNGSGFVSGALVNVNGLARSTAYISSNQLTVPINAVDLVNSGSFNVTVTNPGAATSNALAFIVTGNTPTPTPNPNLTPVISSILPSSAVVGSGAFTLTVLGGNFTPNSQVSFNGLNRTTGFVSSNRLTALIPASDLGTTGLYVVSVTNPAPGGMSNDVLFTVSPTSVTPVLPNTGFGPADQPSGWNAAALAGLSVLGLFLVAVGARRAWIAK